MISRATFCTLLVLFQFCKAGTLQFALIKPICAVVSKTDEFCIRNEEFCIKNEEFVSKKTNFVSKTRKFVIK